MGRTVNLIVTCDIPDKVMNRDVIEFVKHELQCAGGDRPIEDPFHEGLKNIAVRGMGPVLVKSKRK